MRDTLKFGSKGAAVRELQTMLNTLGAILVTDGDFGDATFQDVCDFQTVCKLEPDGIVGPKTWAALEQEITRRTLHLKKLEGDRLMQLGQKVIARAEALWQSDIYDPKHDDFSADAQRCKQIISKMIRGKDALDWSWEREYTGDGDFQWCGAFAAFCWGAEVKQPLRQLYFASTLRLDRYASYRSFQGEPNTGSGRLYAQLDENSTSLPFEPQAGDILVVGPPRPHRASQIGSWKSYGQHICLVEGYDAEARIFRTIEGNGNGKGPHGEVQQGVVKAARHLGGMGWHARRLIRPSLEDLV